MASNYGNKSISSLKDEQQVRQRPAVIFGTNDIQGCAHAIFEIIANSIDEAREGYGDLIEISITEDNEVTVKDNGRGVPMDWNENEEKYNWELVFCTLYASGKYDSTNYSASLGLNGLGATSTQYASEYMVVESIRDGKKYTMRFEKGRPVGKLKIEKDTTGLTGTTIRFKPDREVFTAIDVSAEFYIDKIRRQAMLHDKVTFILRYKDLHDIELSYPNGLKDFIDQICEKQYLPKGAVTFTGSVYGSDDEATNEFYTLDMKLAMTFSREPHFVEMYHNGAYLKDAEENVTDMAVRAGIALAITDFARAQGKISKGEKINYKDIDEVFVAVGATSCPGNMTFFKNQTKTAVGNPFIRDAFATFVRDSFSRWAAENKVLAEKVVAEVLLNKQARESAEAVKKKVLKKLSAPIETIGGTPEKFIECAEKDPKKREIYIVEGDSAAGSCKLARDPKFQAIMPVRGKILNCLKADINHILNNDIITDLIKLYGCGLEIESKHIKDLPKFNIDKLNWDKIIFCTDADLDGMQIRCLLITMIYRLMPSLLKEGKIYIAETPLYEIIAKKKVYFAYDDAERAEILTKLHKEGIRDTAIKINRSKGLGENDPEMMSISTMHPNTRRLVQIGYIEDDKQLVELINALLGDDIEGRRFLIDEYFDIDVDID